jgi:hypothetical protein
MLTDLEDLQQSDESVWSVEMSFDIETRSEEDGELVHKEYTFHYTEEWDKWVFSSYEEKRTPKAANISDRNWRRSRQIYWDDTDAPSIDVPPEVSKQLEEATGAKEVVLQSP